MSQLRFSLTGLLVGFIGIALLFGAMRSLGHGATPWEIAIAGLNVATLLFAACCLLMEQTTARILVVSIVFYAWGFSCLFFGDAIQWGGLARLLLAISGVTFVSWGLAYRLGTAT